MTFIIRHANADEVPMLCDSIAALPLWQQLSIPSSDLQFACSHDPDRIIKLAERDGNVAGCIMFRPVRALDFLCERVFRSGIIYPPGQPAGIAPRELRDGGYVNMLAVFEGYQGEGAGAMLLQAAEEISATQSPRMYLCVSQVNPRGRKFYERQGYRFVAEARDCVRPGNVEHLMEKVY